MRIALALILLCVAWGTAEAGYNEGIDAYERGDYAAALTEFLPLARAGDAQAQTSLGVLYHHGLGVEANLQTAVEWYGRAARNNDPLAQRLLGDLHLEGVAGTPDHWAAAQWYEAAALSGDDEARRKLRKLYEQGHKIPLTAALARKWFGRSAKGETARRSRPKTRSQRTGKTKKRQIVWTTINGNKRRNARRSVTRNPPRCLSGNPDAPYDVKVKVEFPEGEIDHSRSIAELGEIAGFGHNVLGLMKPDIRLETHPKPQIAKVDGKYCMWVTGFDIVMRYHRVDIFVAREYPWGSCPYNAILMHEDEHVAVARKNLNKYAPRVEKALASNLMPTGRNPALFDSLEQAGDYILDLSTELLDPVYESMLTALQKAQKAVDSPESYARVRRRCKNW